MKTGKIHIRVCAALLLVLAVAFSGCGNKPEPQPKPLPPVRVTPQQQTMQEQQGDAARDSAARFAYNPEGYRDPFVSLLTIRKAELEVPLEELPPLQRVPVTDMTLEGIILMGRKSVAHVITPDGKAHIVTVGTRMGRNKGRVVEIRSDAIVVDEEFENYLGKKFSQETVLKLRQKEEGEI